MSSTKRNITKTTHGTDARSRNSYRAKISRFPDGTPLGLTIFLPVEDLTTIDIDPETTDLVVIHVEDSALRLTPVEQLDGDADAGGEGA